MIKIKSGNLYLVTGASGFLGFPLVKKITEEGGRVRALARDEGKLIDLKEKFPSIEIHPGDIYDKFEIKQAMDGVHGVFHLAASKHVGLAETYVRENVKSNTLGSLNILEESLNHPDLEFILGDNEVYDWFKGMLSNLNNISDEEIIKIDKKLGKKPKYGTIKK